ncbi:MAG: beta-ketoacyl-ACP synthase [Cyanobacteria bacterium P01_H01_bin.15]
MPQVVVTGIGLLSSLGSAELTWKNLLAGLTGIQRAQPFLEFSAQPLGLIKSRPSTINELLPVLVLDALRDAGLSSFQPDCGVVIGSSRGCQQDWETQLFSEHRTTVWTESLPHQAAVLASTFLQAQGPVLSPMAACATGIWAIVQGAELIRQGLCDRVVAGAVEAPITRLSIAGFSKIRALAKTGLYPFDSQREGLVLGEGGALFVLEKLEVARARLAPRMYGEVLGAGLTCDAYHVSAPASDNRMAKRAITECLRRSQLMTEQVGYVHAHGTSTRLNDAREADLLSSILPEAWASSTKGATGHTLGASGALGLAFCLLALRDRLLPPCVGLREAEFPLRLVQKTISEDINYALSQSFGFGGQNAVVAVGRIE